jgi:hypothetical protein
MKKLLLIGLICLLTGKVFSQSIRDEYQKSQRESQAATQNQNKVAQEEAQSLLAAKKYGTVFYCPRVDTLLIFNNSRVFQAKGSNLDDVKGTKIHSRTYREEKVFYRVKGDWISWDDSWTVQELNLKTGDIYYKQDKLVNEDKAGCKKVR